MGDLLRGVGWVSQPFRIQPSIFSHSLASASRLPLHSERALVAMVVFEEARMRRFAWDDARQRARLREIGSWFRSMAELRAEAQAVLDGLSEAEEDSLFGRARRRHALEVLMWAMDQADSPVPVPAQRWAAFTSFDTTPLAPAMRASAIRATEGVVALPAPGSALAPIVIQEEETSSRAAAVAAVQTAPLRRSARLAPPPPAPTVRRSARLARIDA